jgi:hypothetical protein
MSLEHSPSREGAAVAGPTHKVSGFCTLEQMSRSELYKLWKQGLGPRFFYAENQRRITEAARQDWHREGEARAAASQAARGQGKEAI